jgi:hypothetical protein
LKSISVLQRFPNRQAILQVYAVIAFLFSAWTIISFLWKLSAWLLILNLGEIFTIFSYAMVVNLLESLTVLMFLLVTCVLLPFHILRDDFVVRGSLLALGIIGSLMAFIRLHREFGMESGLKLLIGPIVVWVLTAILLAFMPRLHGLRFLHSAIFWISDRMIVFLYVLVPLYIGLFSYILFRTII